MPDRGVEIPPGLWNTGSRVEVGAYLIGVIAPGKDKVRAFKFWAKWHGVKLSPEEIEALDASGLEAPPGFTLPPLAS